MKLIFLSFAVLCLLIFTTSCNYFKRSNDTKAIYTVRLDKIDVKQNRDPGSKIIGSVYKGDTIIPTKAWNLYYIAFDYKGTTGFVNVRFLNSHIIPNMDRVSNMQLSGVETLFRDYLNDYVNWRMGRFWFIMLILIISSYILIKLGRKLEDYMYYNFDFDEFNYNKLPYFSAIIGGLYSIAYVFFRENVLQAMFVTKFYWIPSDDSWLHWYLWMVSLMGVIGLLYFWIKDFLHYGYRGIITVLYFTFTAIITFNVGLLGGIVAILFVGVWIIGSMTKGIRFGTGSTSNSSNKKTAEEKLEYFYEQKERDSKD